MINHKYPAQIALLAALIFTLCATPVSANQKNTVGKGSATLDNVYQGKIYYPLQYPVYTPYAGEITKKFARVGQKVKKGDALLQVALQDGNWINLQNSIDKELVILQTELNSKRIKRTIAKLETQKQEAQKFLQEGMGTQKKVSDLVDEISFQKLTLSQSEKSLAKIKRDLTRQRSLISEQLGQKIINRVPRHLLVKAPTDGYVIWENINTNLGALTSGHVCTIGTMDPMIVRIQMYEADVFDLKVGDTAEVILEFAAKQVRQAVVKSISWVPLNNNIESPSYYFVELEIANPDLQLKEGYKVRVMFPEKE